MKNLKNGLTAAAIVIAMMMMQQGAWAKPKICGGWSSYVDARANEAKTKCGINENSEACHKAKEAELWGKHQLDKCHMGLIGDWRMYKNVGNVPEGHFGLRGE